MCGIFNGNVGCDDGGRGSIDALRAVLWIAASYLIGSVPFGLLVSKAVFKQDLRKLGSGNIGATNVMRNFGVKPFIAVMLLDMGKGVAAVAIGRALGLGVNLSLLAGLAAIIGHNWSVFLGFKGGKGIATSAGVIFAAFPWPVTAASLGAFLVMVLITRIMSVGSISGATALLVSTLVIFRGEMGERWLHVVVAAVAYAFVVYKHRDNIGRLLKGEEPRLSLPGKSRPGGVKA